MSTVPWLASYPDDRSDHDDIIVLHGATWADYERLLRMRGDRSAPRIAYLEGEIEIMSPGWTHQWVKSGLGRLVETWCLAKGIDITAVGSWTVKRRKEDRGVEPDECYVLGPEPAKAKRPDLAIEVVWTSGGLDKPGIYRKLDVREVWFWERGRLTLHSLRADRYVRIPRSVVLRGIDLEQLLSFLSRPTLTQAIRDYRAALARAPKKRRR